MSENTTVSRMSIAHLRVGGSTVDSDTNGNLALTAPSGKAVIVSPGVQTPGGGTAPASFTPGLTTVAKVVDATKNVILICSAAGTQSANAKINSTDIGAQWAAGQVVPLKAGDTITWTGSGAPTFLVMTG